MTLSANKNRFADAAEILARSLADAGRVEDAWCIRGIVDGLFGEDGEGREDEAGDYGTDYTAGANGVIHADAHGILS